MDKFRLIWGLGSVLEIKIIYKEIIVEADDIDKIDPLIILPDYIKSKTFYVRIIFTSNSKRNYDYGSYSEFIECEKIKAWNNQAF